MRQGDNLPQDSEAQEEHYNDPGHGGCDSEFGPSIRGDADEQEMNTGSLTLPADPSSPIGIMNLLLMSKKTRKKRGPRLIPDTPYDDAIVTVAKKLRETEADPSAIEYLCDGIFPDGKITLEALKEPIPVQVATKFQVDPDFQVDEGVPMYRGLLSMEREVFNCRLCPEDNKLDFKDPEEALHHMTKDHFDMGYSCSCGW